MFLLYSGYQLWLAVGARDTLPSIATQCREDRQPFSRCIFPALEPHLGRPAHPQRSAGSGGKFPPWPPDPG